MTKNISSSIALLAGIAALLPCSLFANAAAKDAETVTEETTESVIRCAGSITCDATGDGNVSTFTCVTTSPDWDQYGDLTDEEIEELNGLYDRLEALSGDSFTEENTDELNTVLARIEELQKKAGWTVEFTDEDLRDKLSEDRYAEYEQITGEIDRLNERLSEILEEAGYTVYSFGTDSDEE